MVTPSTQERLRELTRLLEQLCDLQGHLVELVQAKIDAMKRADMAAMRECAVREKATVAEIQKRESLRRGLMAGIGKELGVPESAARGMTVSQLAARLPAAQATPLTAAVERLRSAVARLSEVNRASGSARRVIVNHLRWVFASVPQADGKPVAYTGEVVPVGPLGVPLFEAAT